MLGAGQIGTTFGAPTIERGHEVRYWDPYCLEVSAMEVLAGLYATRNPHVTSDSERGLNRST